MAAKRNKPAIQNSGKKKKKTVGPAVIPTKKNDVSSSESSDDSSTSSTSTTSSEEQRMIVELERNEQQQTMDILSNRTKPKSVATIEKDESDSDGSESSEDDDSASDGSSANEELPTISDTRKQPKNVVTEKDESSESSDAASVESSANEEIPTKSVSKPAPAAVATIVTAAAESAETTPTIHLSKSWVPQSLHVPMYDGGTIVSTVVPMVGGSDPSATTIPVLLGLCDGDVSMIHGGSGELIRTLRKGMDFTSEDQDDEEFSDGDDVTILQAHAGGGVTTMITGSANQLLRVYHLTATHTIDSTTITIECRLQQTLKSTHSLPLTALEFHPGTVNGPSSSVTYLATGSKDATVQIWDLRHGHLTHVFQTNVQNRAGGVSCIVWRGGGHNNSSKQTQAQFAVGTDSGNILHFDLADTTNKGQPVCVLGGHVGAVTAMLWNPTPTPTSWFFSVGRDRVICTWKEVHTPVILSKKKRKAKETPTMLTKYEQIHTLPVYEMVESLLADTNATTNTIRLISAGSRGLVRVWECTIVSGDEGDGDTISSLTCVQEQPSHQAFGEEGGGYTSLFRSHPSNTTVPASIDSLIAVDAQQGIHHLSYPTNNKGLLRTQTIIGNLDEILHLKILSPTTLVLATNSNTARILSIPSFTCTTLLENGHTDTILCLDATADGAFIATAGKDNTVRVWRSDGTCVAVGRGHVEAIGALSIQNSAVTTNSGDWFVMTGSRDKTIKKWRVPKHLPHDGDSDNIAELEVVTSVRAHEKDINVLSISPNDTIIASASQDRTIKLWNNPTLSKSNNNTSSNSSLTLRAILKGHKRGVWDVAFSPHDRVLASGSGDGTVKLWSLGRNNDTSPAGGCRCVRTFQGHSSSVLRVRFLSGGLQLMSSGGDGLLKLWTLRTNECETTLDSHTDKVWALDILPQSSTDSSSPITTNLVISGGADSRLVIWNDVTQIEEEELRREEQKAVELEQKLMNHLRGKEYEKALELSLKLDKPFQAHKVLTSLVESELLKSTTLSNDAGLSTLKFHVSSWSPTRLLQVLSYIREWNTKSKTCHMAMLLLRAILTTVSVPTLSSLKNEDGKGDVMSILAGIVPYAERHFERMDGLVGSTYLVDYALFAMGALIEEENELESTGAGSLEEWEKKSKLLVPITQQKEQEKRMLGSDVGRKLIGNGYEENDEDVETIGESDSDSDEDGGSSSQTGSGSDDEPDK